jgi:hypothetical protein
VSRENNGSEFTVGDLLLVAASAGLGLVLGYFAAERVGRVNTRRVTSALRRWKGRRPRASGTWTEEDADHLEARVLDALRRDAVLGRRAVKVRVFEHGIVELSGRVAHPSEVGLAGDVAAGVEGAVTVLNHLLVGAGEAAGPAVAGPGTPRAARG